MKIRLKRSNQAGAIAVCGAVVIGGVLFIGGCVMHTIIKKAREIEEKRKREERRRQEEETNDNNHVFFHMPSKQTFKPILKQPSSKPKKPGIMAAPMQKWETSTNLVNWEPSHGPGTNRSEPMRFYRIVPIQR